MLSRRDVVKGAAFAGAALALPGVLSCRWFSDSGIRVAFEGLWAFHLSDSGLLAFTPNNPDLHSFFHGKFNSTTGNTVALESDLSDDSYSFTGLSGGKKSASELMKALRTGDSGILVGGVAQTVDAKRSKIIKFDTLPDALVPLYRVDKKTVYSPGPQTTDCYLCSTVPDVQVLVFRQSQVIFASKLHQFSYSNDDHIHLRALPKLPYPASVDDMQNHLEVAVFKLQRAIEAPICYTTLKSADFTATPDPTDPGSGLADAEKPMTHRKGNEYPMCCGQPAHCGGGSGIVYYSGSLP